MNKINILKVPFSKGGLGKTEGTYKAPDLIINFFNNLYLKENQKKSLNITEVKIDNSNVSVSYDNIFLNVNDLIKNNGNNLNIVLGGDHSITYPCFKSFFKNYENAGIIIFDAHPDLMNYTTIHTHEDYLRKLIEDNYLKKENIVLIGIRNIHSIEKEYLIKNKIKYYSYENIFNLGIENICDEVMTKARCWSNLYISIDIDALDPSICPATNYPEPGGLNINEFFYFIKRLKFLKKLKMLDIVEVDPTKDLNDITSITAAKIIDKFITS